MNKLITLFIFNLLLLNTAFADINVQVYSSSEYSDKVKNDYGEIAGGLLSIPGVRLMDEGSCTILDDEYSINRIILLCMVTFPSEEVLTEAKKTLEYYDEAISVEKIHEVGVDFQFVAIQQNFINSSIRIKKMFANTNDLKNFVSSFIRPINENFSSAEWNEYFNMAETTFGSRFIEKAKRLAVDLNVCSVRAFGIMTYRTDSGWKESPRFFDSKWLNWEKCNSIFSNAILAY